MRRDSEGETGATVGELRRREQRHRAATVPGLWPNQLEARLTPEFAKLD